ncbi:YbaB/EbfC family nucleoid-associated protein [Saccharomonospora sp. NPDC046836]|uniref:YbaB/EbfC family nucleoid-associated protein n=1 Tax=Saccharomonospora sp. NPDC046836 TaxID=3156921 RepID=UPI0033F7FF72
MEDFSASMGALQGLMDDLKRAVEEMPKTQDRLLSLTGVAWSADGMVKVVVGPRGQLVDLEIDPRVLRKPDVRALAADILAASGNAVANVMAQMQDVMGDQLPAGISEVSAKVGWDDSADTTDSMLKSDAELLKRKEVER